ncbi:MAG: serine--tRNA ligase [Spirochaetes bacterium GWF1_51_8]|nr:MAG: serine--tRNA ligase [Spirochaetes bacterium GWF1_51_8]
MLDIKYLLENKDEAAEKLAGRKIGPALIRKIVDEYEEKKTTQKEADDLRNRRNTLSKEIGVKKSKGENADELMNEVAGIKTRMEAVEAREKELDESIRATLLNLPNLPRPDVPVGQDESANKEVSRWGTPVKLDFTPLPHQEIGEKLGIIDFERGAKIAGHGFILYCGAGALLERALINFMLDTHTEAGFREHFVPFLVNAESLTGTGQLPKFKDEMMYQLENENLFLNPTAEVPLTNIYRDEILAEKDLPIWVTAYAPSFRRESGSYGKDTKGLIRVHQFNKVELVKFSKPEESEAEHRSMLEQAEKVLRLLNLPYRVIVLSTGDMGFAASKCYDIEVWLPSLNGYKEISSVSNCTDFQARRANIRFRRADTKKVEFVHTLNGSGLAVGRTMVAVLENCQTKEGTVRIPGALLPYMRGVTEIK